MGLRSPQTICKPGFSSEVCYRTAFQWTSNRNPRGRNHQVQPEVQKEMLFFRNKAELDRVHGLLLSCINHVALVTEENPMCTAETLQWDSVLSIPGLRSWVYNNLSIPFCWKILIWSHKWETVQQRGDSVAIATISCSSFLFPSMGKWQEVCIQEGVNFQGFEKLGKYIPALIADHSSSSARSNYPESSRSN